MRGSPPLATFEASLRLIYGDYRVTYRIEPPDLVLVLKIGHRREVYEE